MFTIMLVFHTLVCVLLVVVILMQAAKGEGLAGAFGGGGGSGLSGAVFGGRGAATFLSKATTVLAIVFMINCCVLAFMSAKRTGAEAVDTSTSIVTEEAQKEMEQQAAQKQQQATPPSDASEGDLFPTDNSKTESTKQPADNPLEPTGAGN